LRQAQVEKNGEILGQLAAAASQLNWTKYDKKQLAATAS